ncbi:MAG: TetR/AcrR family transcriptional regulator [Actinomycetota bacterium]|nr:TetR/AcrR family transcriptional regulator [Actinomycetota bacterium]
MAPNRAGPARHPSVSSATRRRSESTQKNDERILDAATREIQVVGVDRLGMTAVARRAGLTTGALYGRYESGGELAAAVWTARVRDRHFALLDRAIAALVDADETIALDGLLRELARPRKETVVALELLASSRRVDELEEIVLSDVRQWIAHWGAGPRTRRRRRRAQVIFTVATIWGVLLHASPGRLRLDWRPLFRTLASSFARPYVEPSDRLVVDDVQSVHAQTSDPVEDALIDAVAAIVARVGLERATASRIARRAGLTSGAIYGRYKTKEDLLDHAIEALLARRFADDLASIGTVLAAGEPGAAMARLVTGYVSPARRDWRQFRIEAHLAALSHPGVAATLNRVQETAKDDYLTAIGVRTQQKRRDLDILARAAQLTPIGLAFADLLIPGVPAIDWRLVLEPLSSPGPTQPR